MNVRKNDNLVLYPSLPVYIQITIGRWKAFRRRTLSSPFIRPVFRHNSSYATLQGNPQCTQSRITNVKRYSSVNFSKEDCAKG